MKWFLVGWVTFGAGGDPGIVQGYVAPAREFRIEMPSQEACEAAKRLNQFQSLECWAKAEEKK